MPKLSIILLTYKSANLLRKCVNSIIEYNPDLDYEFIIINNDDEQSEEVKLIFKDHKNVQLIEPGYNTYFAGGINVGLEKAQGEYVAFINDDGYFIDNSLEKMYNFISEKRNEYFAVTGNIYNDNEDRDLTLTATKLPTVLAEISRTTFIGRLFKIFNYFPQYYTDFQMLGWNREEVSRDIECGCDAFIVLHKKDFIDNGGFDKSLRLYYTEENIGEIAKKIQKKIMYLHNTKMIHKWNYATKKQPSSKILAITISDRFYYFKKFKGHFYAYLVTVLSIIGNPIMMFRIFGVIKWLLVLKKEKNDK